MQPIDYVLIAALVLAAFFAVRHIRKKRGSCCGDCASCRKTCTHEQNGDRP